MFQKCALNCNLNAKYLHHEIEPNQVHPILKRMHMPLRFARRADIMSFLHCEIVTPLLYPIDIIHRKHQAVNWFRLYFNTCNETESTNRKLKMRQLCLFFKRRYDKNELV